MFICHYCSDSSPSEGQITTNSGKKNKQPEDDSSADKHEVKRLKFDETDETQSEKKDSSCGKGSESLSEDPESSKVTCGQECESGASGDTTTISENQGMC